MIVAFSSSSRVASVALLGIEGSWSNSELAPARASEACVELLQDLLSRSGAKLESATGFVADIGPGSFTGVRVGVVLAKTLGYRLSVPVAGANAFDLISATETVVLPSKKNEWFVRLPGEKPFRTTQLPEKPWTGFGVEGEAEVYPSAANFKSLLGGLRWESAATFVPEYLIDPSISTPKKPFVRREVSY